MSRVNVFDNLNDCIPEKADSVFKDVKPFLAQKPCKSGLDRICSIGYISTCALNYA